MRRLNSMYRIIYSLTWLLVCCFLFFAGCKKTADGTAEISAAVLTIDTPDSISLAGVRVVCNIDIDLSLFNYTYGFCYDTTRNPRIPGLAAAAQNYTAGRFSLVIPDIPYGFKYYVRAFATNGTTVRYSNLDSFILPAFLNTLKASNITARTFEIGISRQPFSNVIDRWGICYGTTSRPTVNQFTSFSNTTDTGITTLKVADTLKPGTVYYARSVLVSDGKAYYGNQVSFTTAGYRAGTGGYIFFDRGDTTAGWRYLEAATDTTAGGAATWGCSGTAIPGLFPGMGAGFENSTAIIASCSDNNIAAAISRNLRRSGKTDWYLPDTTELAAYHQLRTLKLIGNKYRLFSSTEFSANECLILDSTGTFTALPKASTGAFILPVRRFK